VQLAIAGAVTLRTDVVQMLPQQPKLKESSPCKSLAVRVAVAELFLTVLRQVAFEGRTALVVIPPGRAAAQVAAWRFPHHDFGLRVADFEPNAIGPDPLSPTFWNKLLFPVNL
jgi:hypothetical protein